MTVPRSFGDRFSYSAAIIDCLQQKKVVDECKAIKLVDKCSRKNLPGLELFDYEKVFCVVVEL